MPLPVDLGMAMGCVGGSGVSKVGWGWGGQGHRLLGPLLGTGSAGHGGASAVVGL